MNILHITTFLQGGAGRVLCNLAMAQKMEENNVYVMSSKTYEPGYESYAELLELLESAHIETLQTDSSFKRDLYLNIKFAEEVRKIIVNKNIDIIHAHASIPALIGIIARSGVGKYVPVIQTMHGWGSNKSKDQEQMDVLILNGVDQVVSVSKNDKNLLIEKGVPDSKILTIYNGVDNKCISNNFQPDSFIMQKLQSYREKGYKILGCIGTICKRKNQAVLLEAARLLRNSEKFYIAFLGEGDLIPDLQEYVDREGLNEHIDFFGYVPNASYYMKYFDYFILPSTSEGLSIAILEAFRERVPVIASDIDAFKELIVDGQNGFLFRNMDAASLKQTLGNLFKLQDGCIDKITKLAHKKYEEEFSLKHMVGEYAKLYDKLIGEGNIK